MVSDRGQVRFTLLFGSAARGGGAAGVRRGSIRPYAALRELEPAVEPVCLEYGVTVSLAPVALSDYLGRQHNPFLMIVRREAVRFLNPALEAGG